MKKNLLILGLVALTQPGFTQFLTQGAEGQGAVLLPLNGAAVSFDIGKTEIAVGANNYSRSLNRNNSRPFRNGFVGANLSVKNSSGIGNLFSSGDIVPAGNFLGFLGFTINNNQSILDAWDKSQVVEMNRQEKKKLQQLFQAYRSDVVSYVLVSLPLIEDDNYRKNKGDEWLDKIRKSPDAFSLRKVIDAIHAEKDPRLMKFLYAFKNLQEPRAKQDEQSYNMSDATERIDEVFDEFVASHTVWRFTPFLFGGIDAREFSWYTGLNSTALAKSFIDTLARGGLYGAGVNFQYGTFWAGATFAFVNGDNFSNLTSKEYTLRTTDTSGNQALLSEKKITGYSGKYSDVKYKQVHIDLVKEFGLGDTSRLISNLYYRGVVGSKDTAYLKNTTNLGLGLYFLGNKSKFLGGLYVELPDVDNNIEKGKPEAERHIRPPFKKLTFGVVTKFTLNSIFGFANRPRKPDL